MSYEPRAYDDEWDEPVVVLVVKGQHDVSRLINLFTSGSYLVEHIDVGRAIVDQVRQHPGGKKALELLYRHGGPDLTQTEGPANG
jgi:hypothetical protein